MVFAKPEPPKEWDGTDDTDANGVVWRALRRDFVVAVDRVKCHRHADVSSEEVRRPLPRGEG
jgi:hypothetical protein